MLLRTYTKGNQDYTDFILITPMNSSEINRCNLFVFSKIRVITV